MAIQSISASVTAVPNTDKRKPDAAPDMEKVAAGKATLRPGMKGPAVEQLHRQLNGAGVSAPKGDTYTAATADAVKKFQSSRGLKASGVVDGHTMESFESSYEPSRKKAPMALTAPDAATAQPVAAARAATAGAGAASSQTAAASVAQAKGLQSYAQQKLTDLGSTDKASGLSEYKAAADRAVAAGGIGNASASDQKLLDRLSKAQQLEAINGLDNPRRPSSAAAAVAPVKEDPAIGRARIDGVHQAIAQRQGKDWSTMSAEDRQKLAGDASTAATMLSHHGDQQRGYKVLEQALKDGHISLGLAGIPGHITALGGGTRSEREMDDVRTNMTGATGKKVDAVIDNDNGWAGATGGAVDEKQNSEFKALGGWLKGLDVGMDVTTHSNGFNTLAAVSQAVPGIHFDEVHVVNPNIPNTLADTQKRMDAIAQHSGSVGLNTTLADKAVEASRAGWTGGHTRKQITAAVRAGAAEVKVLSQAGHSLESMSHQRQIEPPDLDFKMNDTTHRLEAKNNDAWRKATGFSWDPKQVMFVRGRVP
jgi:peptidoglycan hydrolase-like protein with peptidoglycan-binding domain